MSGLVELEAGENTPHDASEIKLRRETDAAKAKRLAAAWDNVLATPQGRAVVWDIIGKCGPMTSPWRPGDTEGTFVAIGRGEVGRELYATIGRDYPGRLLEMEKENMR